MRLTLAVAALLVSTAMLVGCKSDGDAHGHDHDHAAAVCCGEDASKCCGSKKECCGTCETKE